MFGRHAAIVPLGVAHALRLERKPRHVGGAVMSSNARQFSFGRRDAASPAMPIVSTASVAGSGTVPPFAAPAVTLEARIGGLLHLALTHCADHRAVRRIPNPSRHALLAAATRAKGADKPPLRKLQRSPAST